MADLAYLKKPGEGELNDDKATYMILDPVLSHAKEALDVDLVGCFRIIKSEKSNPGIWDDLPDPQGYDGSRLMREI